MTKTNSVNPPELLIPDLYSPLFQDNEAIIKYPNVILRTQSLLVEDLDDAKIIISKMLSVLNNTTGVGLAAPQIGENKQIIIIKHEKRHVIINPVIEEYSGFNIADEGCLSVPGLWGKVIRCEKIVLRGLSQHGKELVLSLNGMGAVVAQHEIDHLNGVLFFDKVLKDSLYWWCPAIDKKLTAEFA